MVVKKYKNGLELNLPSCYRPLVDNGWYTGSEIETQDWIIDNMQPDWVTFDCGAHIGYYSMLASYCASEGKVYAFEANEKTCGYFRDNIAANGKYDFSNIELIKAALGDKVVRQQETLWFAGQGNDGIGETAGVYDFTTVDSFCEVRGIERLDLIKTDVDGWDYELLLGAEETIHKFRPVIIAEVNYALGWRGYSSKDVEAFLDKIGGYKYRAIDAGVPNNWLMESVE